MFNKETHSLVLRACREDMSSKNGFMWPTSGVVECPDWDSVPECGNGLHGWLYGHGDGNVSDYWSKNDKWLVVSVETYSIIELNGKVKFPKGEVLFCGDRKSATDFLMEHEPRSKDQPVISAFITVSDNQTATTGYNGTSTSGDYGTSTSGNYGTSISGKNGTSTSGNGGKSKAGVNGIIQITYYENNRKKLKVGYIGEDGLEPDTFYFLDSDFNFVKW